MRSLIRLLVFVATVTSVEAASKESSVWDNILGAVQLSPAQGASVILPADAVSIAPEELHKKVNQGQFLILEGASAAAESFGFKPTAKSVTVRSAIDIHEPRLPLIWEKPSDARIFELPEGIQVFTKERWSGVPLVAGMQRGKGGVMWLATDPGLRGHDRYPHLVHALRDLGLEPVLTSRRLWVFLDTSYRMRVDPEYMAKQWRKNGVAALHIAAWHYFEPNQQRDDYLRRFIGAAHKNAIHVYAWLELPHVSERFWEEHPTWREKTASGPDAHLDWRKLMNLRNPDCAANVKAGVDDLLHRFDWDGVNLAELYFESLEGHQNPSRFTPMNQDVRQEFQKLSGTDPITLFQAGDGHWSKNASRLTQFLTYRADLARAMQQEWIGIIEAMRAKDLPQLDLVLTHVDNLLEPETRERIGADAKQMLPLMQQHDFTFLVEDPATAWSLGPERYTKIASQYAPLVKQPQRLAVDVNVVERYQDVYPTKQQIGTELFREVHLASEAFARLTLYFESSIRKADWPFLGPAGAVTDSIRLEENKSTVHAKQGLGLRWKGPAKVNGALWPVAADGIVWLPAGQNVVEPGDEEPAIRITEFNGELKSAWAKGETTEFAYESTARAFAVLNKAPKKMMIDGVSVEPKVWVFEENWILVLPRGQHVVSVTE